MFGKTSLVVLAASVAVSALEQSTVHHLVTRQLSPTSVPQACQSQCSSALNIYDACLNGDTNTCLSVCDTDNYNGFVGCFSCILDNTPGVTQTEVSQLNDAVGLLASACSAAGKSVPTTSLTAPVGAASGTGAATGSATDILGSAGASFTSALGGLTISGSSTSGLPSSAGGVSSTSAAASSSGLALGGASSSGAAAFAAKLPNFVGVAVGLVGVVAGAAFVL